MATWTELQEEYRRLVFEYLALASSLEEARAEARRQLERMDGWRQDYEEAMDGSGAEGDVGGWVGPPPVQRDAAEGDGGGLYSVTRAPAAEHVWVPVVP